MELIPKVTIVFLIHQVKLRAAKSCLGKKVELFPSLFIIIKDLFLSRQGHSLKINMDSLTKINSGEVKQKT